MKNLFCLQRERERENIRSLFLHICKILCNAYMHYCIPTIKKITNLLKLDKKLRFPYYRLDTHDLCPVCNYLPTFWYFKEIMKKNEKENFISDKT